MNSTARNIRSVGSKQVARTHSDAAEPTATPAVTPQMPYLPILSENGSPDNSDTPSATQDATSSLIGIAPGGSGSGPDGSAAVTYLRCSRCEEGIPVDVVPAVDAFRGLPVCDRCARAQRHVRRAK